ncbi:MAG: sulfatase-like hydrolase/transferase [Candidatus Nanopelagicales bacterium]
MSRFTARLGERRNTSAYDSASWLLAAAVLAVVIPANEKIAANDVFFSAHGVSQIAWVVVLAVALVALWLLLAGVLTVLKKRLKPSSYDIAASAIMFVVAWFLAGNVLTQTLFTGVPALGPIIGLVVAAGVTLLARRFTMGSPLFVFASIAAVAPLVLSVFAGSAAAAATPLAFAPDSQRPSIMWIVSDELQYPLVFDQAGKIRPEFPNLQALQADSTTYTHAYSAANYTDYAVPSMLTGISDIAAEGPERMQEVRANIGIVPSLASEYSVVMESPIYRFECDTTDCASVGSAKDSNVVSQYLGFAADTAAIAGRTALSRPFSDAFPSLDGKWRDFWSGGDEFGDNAEGNSVSKAIAGLRRAEQAAPSAPTFSFWHTIRTHAPWNVDREGREIYPSRLPIVDDAHMVGSNKAGTYSTPELQSIERRLYANSAIDFDRQLGQLIAELKTTGRYDNTIIVLTADHGATMTVEADRRVGDTLEQRWAEVAHVPLMVKDPNQVEPATVVAPRSTGQIARTVLIAAGATAPPELALSPDLSNDLPGGPVFATVGGGVMTPWVYEGIAEPDPWLPEDLTPPSPDHPFAIGIDQALLGGPVPAGWQQVEPDAVDAIEGESTQQLVVVERQPGACDPGVTTGLVSSGGVVTGSVLWQSASSNAPNRGWAIVPKSESYEFWCR